MRPSTAIAATVVAAGMLGMAAAGCASPAASDRADEVPPPTPPAVASVDSEDGTPSPWLPSRAELERRRRLEQIDPRPALGAASRTVSKAVQRAGDETVGWWGDLPASASYETILDPDRTVPGSVSVGTVSRGELEDSAQLPVSGDHYSVIERHRRRNTQSGTDELVDAVRHAAGDVADTHPGSTLRVGNLARPTGGDIPWSHSHNTGRDVDLAFYCEEADTGRPVVAPDLIEFGPEGRAVERPDLEFDVERNWTLVKSLLTYSKVSLQWLFISRPLKEMLLEHARDRGEPDRLIRRARKVLHQPTDAPPHADHLHVRIACSKQDRLEGCLDYGPRWEWVDWHRRDLLARSLELGRALRRGAPKVQLDALDFLRTIQSPYAPEVALVHGARAEDPRVRREALDVASDIARWSPAAVGEVIALLESGELTRTDKPYAYTILRRSRTRRGRRFALSRLLSSSFSVRERVLAARALSHVLEPGLVPILTGELEDQPPAVREECARVLRRITGHREIDSWTSAARSQQRKAVEGWREWWNAHRSESRARWLRRAFGRHGYEPEEVFDREAIGELIELLPDAPDHLAYSANRALHRITGRWIPYEGWSYDRLHDYWRSWWRAQRHERAVAGRSH